MNGKYVILGFGIILIINWCWWVLKVKKDPGPKRIEYLESIRKILDNPLRPYKLYFKTKSGKKIYSSWYFEKSDENDDIIIVLKDGKDINPRSKRS